MLKSRFIAAVFIWLIISSSVYAQSPQITNGLSWLYSAQTTSGNWLKVATTEYYSTAAALDSIYSVDPSNQAYGPAFQWLSSQIISPTDYLSRQIIALKRAGQDTSGYVANLLLYRNLDSGFGGAEDCPNSYSLDTALALQALSAISYSDTSLIGQSLSYLMANQNTDGGWSLSPNDASNTYLTSVVLKTLAVYNTVFINQNSINKASAFLLAHQNTDGGFGNSPSTVYDTALSLMSLIESGQGSTQTVLSGISYLTSSQLADGSWNDDPYSTALALQALAEARPNLAVSSAGITFSNSMPQSGATTTIGAVIGNTGYDNASNVVVRFFLGDPSAGGTQIGTDQIIPFIALGSSAQASITVSFTGTGGKTIFVVADPDNLISETTKADNKASARVWFATGPDLAVYSEDLKPMTYVPVSGMPFTLSYTVRNLGDSAAGAFVVSLYDGDPKAGGTLLMNANIPGLAGTQIYSGTLGVTLTTSGNHTLYLVADSGNQITEISKTNNTGSVTVNVGGIQTPADLAITPMDITLTPSRPHAGDTVTISANVRNIGAEAANNFTVEIFDGAPEAGGTLITSQAISLVAGGTQTVTANWPIPAGIHDVYVILDRMNSIIETNENNNRASVRVMTDMVDIIITATDLTFTPAHPVNGDSVVFSITAHNTGIKDTSPFNLALYNGDPNAGGILLQTYPISDIAGDGTAMVTYTFTALPQTYRFYAVADADNKVVELTKTNNTAIRSLTIKAPGQVLGPDLAPTKIDLSDITTDPQTLAISGNAHVTFQNKGDDKITTPFNVIIFEDKDGDGKYTAGVDNLLSTATNTLTIWPEGAGLANLPLSGTVQFLHSPLYAYVDSGDAILEQDETNNLLVSCKDCEVVPSNPIQPMAKWTKTDGNHTIGIPFIANLNGKNSPTSAPAIIYVTPWVPPYVVSKLYAIDGKTGNTLFVVQPSTSIISQEGMLAVGDIDGDGLPEIVVPKQGMYGKGLLAYSNTGVLKWDNTAQVAAWDSTHWPYQITIHELSAPVIADIDGDGIPEIIEGVTVINNDGSIRWVGSDAYATYGKGQYFTGGFFSIVADLDLDGKQEIIGGHTAYNSNGTIKWNANLPDGMNAIGNFDGDPYPEIVLVTTRNDASPVSGVYLLEHDGKVKWGPVYLDYFWSPPVVADFDGDGEPEIGVRTQNYFYILDKNGNLKNTLNTPYNPGAIGGSIHAAPAVFDLNGDGRPEVLFNSDYYFRIFDGKAGTLLYQESFKSASAYQGVIIADVDNDGQAEAVLTGDGSNGSIRVYGSANHDWVGARGIWNQLSYHVTNVNDDGTIPQYESPSWLLNNTYRTQAAIGPNPNPYLTPNLTASYMRIEQAGSSLNIAVRVGNGGAIASGPTVTVTFYDGIPSSDGTVMGTAYTTRALNPGDYQDVIYSWTGGSLGLHHVYAVVDAANAISECRKDDNQVNADFMIQTSYADLKVGPEDISLPAGPYTAGIPVTITANVKNIGTLPASNIAVRLYYGNPTAGGTQVGNDHVIPSINAASSVPFVFTYDTTGKSGTNVLYIVVDPANTIIESSKTNNTAAITLTVQPPTLPDLSVTVTDIQVSPATLHEGNTALISAAIHNLGVSTGNIPVSFYLGNPASGGTLIASQTIYPLLALGGATTVQASLDTTGHAGQQQIYVVIDPGNSIIESRKDNNGTSQSFFVQSAGLTTSVALDNTAYQADTNLTATITAGDTTGISRSLTLGLYVQDSAGNKIATISTADPVAINPNSMTTLSRTWNTGATLSGQYTIIAELAESGQVISRKSTGFTILTDSHMNASVTTDKISYNPNETAALTAVATSQSRNFIFNTLTAVLTIGTNTQTNPSGTIYTDTKTITTLMPGATFTFKDYWSIGINAPGTYPITLTIRDSTGAVIATGAQNLTISTIVKPTAVLRGQISVGTQELLTGDTTTVSYTVTNVGNTDLQNFSLSVLAVNLSDQTVYDAFTYPTTLAMGGVASNTFPITTANYTAKDYLVILRANIAGTEETLSGTYFRIEGAPSAPSLANPANGTDVLTFTPTLSVNNASDPNDDKLTYQFELYSDSGLTQLVASSGLVTEGTGITSWSIPVSLTENQTYFWRSRAYDNWLYGPWISPASFRVNTVNDPPTAPTIASPADNTEVSTSAPILTINNASDPDSASLTYNFVVSLDPDFISIVSTTSGVAGGQGTTSLKVNPALSENTWYYWRAQADDWLDIGPWSTIARFFVNTNNDPPTIPKVLSPANNAVIPGANADIVLENSTDIDSWVISYYFEVDVVPTFDSGSIIRSGAIPGGPGTTTWLAIGLLDNTTYFVRARAGDGSANSEWSQTISFFVNSANDAPTAPTLANPSNGAGVTVFTPTLSIHDATDPDRDVLTYDFEVYSNAGLTTLVTSTTGVVETSQITNWIIPVSLIENQSYYWRARAFDGKVQSPWMPQASFMVNTANDAPGAPTLYSPADGSTVTTLNPALSVTNATDPDSPSLTYFFEVYSGTTLVTSITNVPGSSSGITTAAVTTALTDNTVYQWRARAFDGNLYGPWTSMASFTVHLSQTSITAEIEFEPETLNKKDHGEWVKVEIELPHGYKASDINIASIRLEGSVHAEPHPYEIHDHCSRYGGDDNRHEQAELTVKFKRSDVIAVLPVGDHVPVHISGLVGSTPFEGVDIIRVISNGH